MPGHVTYVDGKCTCCAYGYHVDLDFLNFCQDLEAGSTLRNLKKIQRTKRNLRKSMEIMLTSQEGQLTDPNSSPPEWGAERLLHMVNYEQSATHNILRHIDESVSAVTSQRGGGEDRERLPFIRDDTQAQRNTMFYVEYNPDKEPDHRPRPGPYLTRENSLTSLSSESSETPFYQAEHWQEHQHIARGIKSTKRLVENPVLEMATAEMKHYSTTSSAQLMDSGRSSTELNPSFERKLVENPVLEMATAEMKHYSSTSSAQLVGEATSPTEFSHSLRIKQPLGPSTTTATNVVVKTVQPRPSPDVDETSSQHLRESLASSIQRIKVLEQQVKTIPILQVRISVLKEEKRLLNTQLKASQILTVTHNPLDVKDNEKHSTNFSVSPPVKSTITSSTGVGDHTILEPYNLQPHLPTGYTIRDNETTFDIYSREFLRDERQASSESQTQILKRSFLHESHKVSPTGAVISDPAYTQSQFRVDQTQKGSSLLTTRTIGVGEGNVLEDSKLQIQGKEVRTLIIGSNSGVAKRNVGIECRVQTRDVGVSFRCDDVKPETRTVGVNVNYDTSGIFTSLDFKGETQLRMAIQNVLHKSVRSVGTNCILTATTSDIATMTDLNVGVSVGCGDVEHSVDVEVRPVIVKKSVTVSAKPDVGNKYVSTTADWVLDASTNTSQANLFDKAVMTEKQKQIFASTNTELTLTHAASIQTEQSVFLNMDQLKHASNNTDAVTRYSTGMLTDIISTRSAATNTTDLYQETSSHNDIISLDHQSSRGITTTLNRDKAVNKADNIHILGTRLQDRTTTSDVTAERQISQKNSDFETFNRSELNRSELNRSELNRSELNRSELNRSELNRSELNRSELNRSEFNKSDINKSEFNKESEQLDNASKYFSSLKVFNHSSTQSHDKASGYGINALTEKDNSKHEMKEFKLGELRSMAPSQADRGREQIVTTQCDIRSQENSFVTRGDIRSQENIVITQGDIRSQENIVITRGDIRYQQSETSTEEDRDQENMITKDDNMSTRQSVPHKVVESPEDKFSETVVEHFLLTKDGKKLISEETITTSSAGTNRTFKQFVDGDIQTTNYVTDNFPESFTGRSTGNIVSSDRSNTISSEGFSLYTGRENNASRSSYTASIDDQSTTLENPLAEATPVLEAGTIDSRSELYLISRKKNTSAFRGKQQTINEADIMSSAEAFWDMRRAGSVEDFMPNDIRRYMSIDPSSTTTRSHFTGDSTHSPSVEHTRTSSTESATSSSGSSKMKSFKASQTATSQNYTGDGSFLHEKHAREVSNDPMEFGTQQMEVEETGKTRIEGFDHKQHLSESSMTVLSSTSETTQFAFSSLRDEAYSNIKPAFSAKDERVATGGSVHVKEEEYWREAVATDSADGRNGALTSAEDSYVSLDRQTAQLKSIIKLKTEAQTGFCKKGITFAENVTGGIDSSSEDENNSSGMESSLRQDSSSYSTQEEERCQTAGYELPDEVRKGCEILATYLTDSTSIQTKQLNASQEVIRQEWFQLSSYKLSSVRHVENFLSSIKDISLRLMGHIVNLTDSNGNTAIHYCISHCNFEIASVLLDSKVCDINKRNKAGYTPIMLAGLVTIQNQQDWDVVRRILSLGDIDAKATETQQTALMIAACHGRVEMVNLLIEMGANLNLQDEDGSTALMCACEHGNLDVVNLLLLQPDVDVNVRDNEGSTALNVAMETEHKDVGVVLYKFINFSKPSSPGSNKRKKGATSPT